MDDGTGTHFENVAPNLSVIDLPRALDFYEKVLGFSRLWIWGDPITLASLCRGRVEITLSQRGSDGPPPGPGRVYLRVSPIDAVWAEVTGRGATVHVPIDDRVYGMRDFAIRDESGNILDFGEAKRLAETSEPGPPAASVMKVFVPAKDFAVAKRFYAALGFRKNWEQGQLAEIELGGTKLLLQDHYQKDWADNFMVHVEVPDADAWARHAADVLADGAYPDARASGPKRESWGYKVAYVIDPSGVCLHFAEPLARPAGS